jgi:hypothetical protein
MRAETRRRRRLLPILWLATLVAATLALAWRQGWLELPPNALPWKAPDLTQPPGWLAHMQVNSLARRPDACIATLHDAEVRFARLPDRTIDDRCGLHNAVRIEASPVRLDRAPPTSCGLAAALVWYQQQLDGIARRTLDARVVRIEHFGTYACRNVNSESIGPRSEHATANAIDVAGYVLSDGRVISVARDWGKKDASGQFLAQAHDAACRVFNVVLGPEYNRLHANHFHLDMGTYRACR